MTVHHANTQSLLPYLNSDPDARNDPTTLSHTFAEYNTIITIYIIGPVSLLFAFRVYRTVNQRDMSQVVRKCVLFVLLCVQYTTIVVIRHDTIQGLAHYIFTGLTFGLLLIYHGLIGSYPKYGEIWWAKWSLALVSILCMVVFAIGMLTSRKNIQDDNVLWTLLCLTEVVAVLSLGCLDIVDIYQLGKDMQKKR